MLFMTRTKLADRVLPTYTKGEEICNMVTHIVSGAMGLVALITCVVVAAMHQNTYGIVTGAIFGISMIVLYVMSSVYHGISPKLKGKKVMQVLDHCTIYFLIAGSYGPFALCTLREYDLATGWTIFAIIWAMAIIGTVFTAIDLKKYKVFSMICYLVMGWCIIFKIHLLPTLLGMEGFWLLLLGGIVYTIGAILYGVGVKHKYMHSVFHVCILIGSLLHFLCIVLYVL